MACFLVSAAEAIVVSAAEKHEEKKEMTAGAEAETREMKVPMSRKLKWLSNFLWGGAILLAFEHIWHGEVVPWFPFLTAMSDPAETSVMLHEMATVGVSMAVLVTIVWAFVCKAADRNLSRVSAQAAKSGVK